MSAKENILAELEKSKGEFVSGEMLAEMLGVSRNAVWKAVKGLEKDGYPIRAVTNRGYMLDKSFEEITKSNISRYLHTNYIGKKLEVFREIDSTNTYAKEKAKERYADNGFTVVAESQTQGRGRMGRSFVSPPDTGIYMSVVLYSGISMETAQLLTSCTAVAVSEAVDKLCGTNTAIKWVNDLFLNGRKFCGILTEASVNFESGMLDYAVIGMGINVKNLSGKIPDELMGTVTSIEQEAEISVSKNELAGEILNSLERNINNIDSRSFMEEYRKRSFIIGENVIVTYGGIQKSAVALDIDDNAGLVVKFDDGEIKTLNSGEARIVKK